MPVEYIDRVPRIQPELPVGEINIPQAPGKRGAIGQNLATLLIPMITVLGFVFMSAGSGNPLYAIPMALTMFLSVGVSLLQSRGGDKETEAKRKEYAQSLTDMRQEMARSHNSQRLFYYHNYPDVSTLYDIASHKETSRFGSRLWERRPDDSDFGVVRLGIGSRPSTVVYKVGQSGGDGANDPLAKDAQRLAQDSEILTDAPITIPLRPYVKEDSEADDGSGEGCDAFGRLVVGALLGLPGHVGLHCRPERLGRRGQPLHAGPTDSFQHDSGGPVRSSGMSSAPGSSSGSSTAGSRCATRRTRSSLSRASSSAATERRRPMRIGSTI